MSSVVRFESTTGPFFWYKQAQLVSHKGRMYDMGRHGEGNVAALTKAMSLNPSQRVATMKTHFFDPPHVFPEMHVYITFPFNAADEPYMFYTVILLQRRTNTQYDPFVLRYECFSNLLDQITPPIRHIQRWMGRVARGLLQAQRLVLAMGLHARLGQASPLRLLCPDLLRTVIVGS